MLLISSIRRRRNSIRINSRTSTRSPLKALVKRKAAGKTIEVPEEKEEESNVIDLMDALKQSLGRKKAAASSAKGRKRHVGAPQPEAKSGVKKIRVHIEAMEARSVDAIPDRQRVAVRAQMGRLPLPPDAGCRHGGHVFEVGPGSEPLFSGSGCRRTDAARKKLHP